jgi:4-azaleucine resistance transporter AzlC
MDKNFGQGNDSDTELGFTDGLKAGVPIAVGYIPSAIACGILCRTAGLTAAESVFMSFIVFAGASQFVALNLLLIGAGQLEIVLATALLNMRHIMMSSVLARRLSPQISAIKRALVCFEMTDESFSVAAMRKEPLLSSEFMFGLNIQGHFTWTFGTLAGYLGTSVLPKSVQDSMGIAIYALFIGLLIPSAQKSRPALITTSIAMALSAFIKWTPIFSSMNRGLAMMTAAGMSALLAAVLFPLGKEQ